MEQALFRKEKGSILIVGERGTGRTALVHGFAKIVASQHIDFLRDKRFIALDMASFASDEARQRLEQIFQIAKREPDVVPVFDGIERLLPDTADIFHKVLSTNTLRIIAITTPDGYLDAVATHDDLNDCFQKLQLKEVTWQDTVTILTGLRVDLEQEYSVQIADEALRAAAKYTAECVLSQRLPRKAIDALKSACDEARYHSRSELRSTHQPPPTDVVEEPAQPAPPAAIVVTEAHVVTVVARKTNIPESVIAHQGDETGAGFADRLRQIVVGQDYAVQMVAERLDLIQKGAVPKNKPAGVFIFVGVSGTGKTELAKAVAQIYSHTGKLIHYQMSNFQEKHTVSGLIGSPPGFVGFEEGGDLVKKLNADPYAVILFDEFEKACPEVHDVLLELCDQAMITDRRGITARANKAFIVMTSNEAKDFIVGEINQGRTPEVIARGWRKKVGEQQPVKIRPEMLTRFDIVAPFGPLKSPDFVRITRLQFERLQKEFTSDFELEIAADDQVLQHLAALAEDDQESGRAVARRLMRHLHGPAVGLVSQARTTGARTIVFYWDEERHDIKARLA
jgi:ATP-dependent Clp protease ATP-binding subunit ClpC